MSVPHPLRALGYFIEFFTARLNRLSLGAKRLRRRGGGLTATVCLLAYAIGYLLQSLSGLVGAVVAVWVVATMLSQRELAYRTEAVVAALAKRRLAAARRALGHIVGRKTASLDRHRVAAAAMESLAENFADAVVAPLFWYLVGGLEMLLVAKAVNTLDSMIGYKNRRFHHFGMVAAHADTALNFIPSRLAALIIAIAAAIASPAHFGKALTVARRDASNHSSLNAGWPEAALAGACGMQLGGTRYYSGQAAVRDKPIGDGTTKIDPARCRRAIRLYKRSCALLGVILLLLIML